MEVDRLHMVSTAESLIEITLKFPIDAEINRSIDADVQFSFDAGIATWFRFSEAVFSNGETSLVELRAQT